MLLEPHFTYKKALWRSLGKALMATYRGSPCAQGIVEAAQHVSIRIANREEFMKCHDDARVWQHASCERQQVNTEQQEVVKVNYVWLNEL
jgi:hypothetical protein